MARRDFDEQVDPFNAADPVMPAEDSSAWHEDECKFDEQDKRDEEELDREWGEEDSQEAGGSSAGKKPSKLTFKFLAIIIVIFSLSISLIGLVTALVGGVFSKMASSSSELSHSELIEELQNRGYHVDDWSAADEDNEESKTAEAEAYLTLVVDDRLSALKNDENLHQTIADLLDTRFRSYYGFTATDAGLDTNAFADKCLDSYTYTITNTFAFPEDNDGSVYVDFTSYRVLNFIASFDDLAYAYIADAYADNELTTDEKSQIKDYFNEVLTSRWELSDTTLCFNFELDGDTWVISENDYQDEIDFAFDI